MHGAHFPVPNNLKVLSETDLRNLSAQLQKPSIASGRRLVVHNSDHHASCIMSSTAMHLPGANKVYRPTGQEVGWMSRSGKRKVRNASETPRSALERPGMSQFTGDQTMITTYARVHCRRQRVTQVFSGH